MSGLDLMVLHRGTTSWATFHCQGCRHSCRAAHVLAVVLPAVQVPDQNLNRCQCVPAIATCFEQSFKWCRGIDRFLESAWYLQDACLQCHINMVLVAGPWPGGQGNAGPRSTLPQAASVVTQPVVCNCVVCSVYR
jgi:hypothetical protein